MTVSTSRIGSAAPSLAQQIPDPWPLYQVYGLVDSVVPSKLPRRCRLGSRSSDAMRLSMLVITDIPSNASKDFTLHDSPANGSTTFLSSVTDTLQCTRSSITLEPIEAHAVSPPTCCLALWLLSLRACSPDGRLFRVVIGPNRSCLYQMSRERHLADIGVSHAWPE